MKRWLKYFATAMAILIVGGCAYVETKQGEWIFNPIQGEWRGYKSQREKYEERWIAVGNQDQKIHAWWAPVADPNAPVLLYLHGARWNLTGSAARIPRWNRMGFSVLAIDYRGFGKSSAHSPTEQSANEDAEAAWLYLQQLAPNPKRFILGHSLGGAMATHLAIKYPDASGLILEASFTNIPALLAQYPLGFLPVGFLVTQRFDNLQRIKDVKIPILFAHGTHDEIVPFNMSEQLFAATTAPKRFLRAEGGSHHNLTANYFDEYSRAVHEHFGLATSASPISAASELPNGGSLGMSSTSSVR